MNASLISAQLEDAASQDDFVARAHELVADWTERAVGLEAIAPILGFLEAHATLDVGAPGPLVHFVERFHGKAYEALLLDSVRRSPTGHTVWMLNRVLGGTRSAADRIALIAALRDVISNQHADPAAVEAGRRFLALHSGR